nr:MAG TPA: RNA polymerase II-binding domain protein [Caudoviricetes sp.]
MNCYLLSDIIHTATIRKRHSQPYKNNRAESLNSPG